MMKVSVEFDLWMASQIFQVLRLRTPGSDDEKGPRSAWGDETRVITCPLSLYSLTRARP